MKSKWTRWAKVLIMMVIIVANLTAYAGQDLTTQVDYADEWYMDPWVWILSGGIFILLFTVILSRKDSSDA